MVDEQREMVYRPGGANCSRTSRPRRMRGAAAARSIEALVQAAGADAVRHAEQRVTIAALDALWADHLARIETSAKASTCSATAASNRSAEFHRQIVAAFGELMERVSDEAASVFARLEVSDGAIDFAPPGSRARRRPGRTWSTTTRSRRWARR